MKNRTWYLVACALLSGPVALNWLISADSSAAPAPLSIQVVTASAEPAQPAGVVLASAPHSTASEVEPTTIEPAPEPASETATPNTNVFGGARDLETKYAGWAPEQLDEAAALLYASLCDLVSVEAERMIAAGQTVFVPRGDGHMQVSADQPDAISELHVVRGGALRVEMTRETSPALFEVRDEWNWLREWAHDAGGAPGRNRAPRAR
jgi:hypothetical protein